MKINIVADKLVVELEGAERLWSFRFSSLEFPLAHVTGYTTALPKTSWRELRAPGSFFPGVIKAGTYFTPRGKEFWYATRWRSEPVVIELKDEPYARLILGFQDAAAVTLALDAHKIPRL